MWNCMASNWTLWWREPKRTNPYRIKGRSIIKTKKQNNSKTNLTQRRMLCGRWSSSCLILIFIARSYVRMVRTTDNTITVNERHRERDRRKRDKHSKNKPTADTLSKWMQTTTTITITKRRRNLYKGQRDFIWMRRKMHLCIWWNGDQSCCKVHGLFHSVFICVIFLNK